MQTPERQSAIGNGPMLEWEKPFASVLGCLLQSGTLAARYGFQDKVETILGPLEAVRPGHPSLKLARALVYIYQDRHQEALEHLDSEVLREEPGNGLGLAFSAMSLHLMGRIEECRERLRAVLREGGNEQALNLARNLAPLVDLPV